MASGVMDVVQAWGRAMADFDEGALIVLADEDIEIATPGGTNHGYDAVRGWLGKQTYGVVPHFEQRRHFVRDDTVVVDLRVEYRYVDGGGSAGSGSAAAVFVVQEGQVQRIAGHLDLASALASAGLEETDAIDVL